ncbi:MAG: 2'-5' RNA ligase family protein [Legionella sp.]|nr:2'-5' RNA ligase family protein [Legionella sp.]
MSEQGRRILITPVEGEPGDRIQAWRLAHDPEQAKRYPPHLTLCYDPPITDTSDALAMLGRQVRHAFPSPVVIRLSGVAQFGDGHRTLYVRALETEALDEARTRLFDGTHLAFPPLRPWPWHVSCLRNAALAPFDLIEEARAGLDFDLTIEVGAVEYRELQGRTYEVIARWDARG